MNYCILTNRITNIGGAQLYTLRRAKYLKNEGYDVKIIVCDVGGDFILKDDFDDIEILCIPELLKPVFAFKNNSVAEILNNCLQFLNKNCKEGIIETHSLSLSIWGELIGQRAYYHHIIYLLSEIPISKYNFYPIRDFFLWKLKKGEMYGVTNVSLKFIMEQFYNEDYNKYVNIPFDANEIVDISVTSILELIPEEAFVISTISRLEKVYVEKLIQAVIEVGKEINNKEIYLVVVGDDVNKQLLTNLKNRYEGNLHNVTIIFPGYIHPIGKDFYQRTNIFVGMGTAAVNSISQSCATITIDPIKSKASGIFGVDNFNFAFPENNKLYTIAELLRKLMTNEQLLNDARKLGQKLFLDEYSFQKCMNKLDLYINSSENVGAYWNFPKEYTSSFRLKCIYLWRNSGLFKYIYSFYRLAKLRK